MMDNAALVARISTLSHGVNQHAEISAPSKVHTQAGDVRVVDETQRQILALRCPFSRHRHASDRKELSVALQWK
jgi:hypothetical protein